MEPWQPVNQRACRQATLLVVSFEATLAEIESDSDLEFTIAARRARRRPYRTEGREGIYAPQAYREDPPRRGQGATSKASSRARPSAQLRTETYGSSLSSGTHARPSSQFVDDEEF